MSLKESAALTDKELLQEAKRLQPTKIYDAVFIGLLIGISIYSIVKNGFGLLTFLPLIYLPIAKKNGAKRTEVNQLLAERGLNQNE